MFLLLWNLNRVDKVGRVIREEKVLVRIDIQTYDSIRSCLDPAQRMSLKTGFHGHVRPLRFSCLRMENSDQGPEGSFRFWEVSGASFATNEISFVNSNSALDFSLWHSIASLSHSSVLV